MKRISRQDRMLLESLENKYGTDAVATAIMTIANRENAVSVDTVDNVVTPQEAVLDFIKFIEGVRIRLREIHWEAERNSRHLLTDDIISSLEDSEDNIAEDLMGICGFRIKVGAIIPKMPIQVELCQLLCELHEAVIQLCACLESDSIYGGIVNELEDLMHKIGKWKYLETLR